MSRAAGSSMVCWGVASGRSAIDACSWTSFQSPSSWWKTALQRGETWLPSGSVIVGTATPQPTLPSVNASTWSTVTLSLPPTASASFFRNS